MKKRVLSILLAAVMVLSLIPAIALSASADPTVYEVSNEDELIAAMTAHNTSKDPGETIKLTADITLSDKWPPLDASSNKLLYVYGTFNGQNHTIYNSGVSDAFLWPCGNCVIENFTLSDKVAPDGDTFTMSGTKNAFATPDSTEIKAGEVVTIRNVTNERSLSGSSNYTGAFFRGSDIAGTIRFENCTNNGNYYQMPKGALKGNNAYYGNNHKIGGFIGCMNSGTVIFENCVNNGDVVASQAGGFIGIYKNCTITMTNCTNNGEIIGCRGSSAYGNAGGFLGAYNNGGALGGNTTITLTNCVNTGSVKVATQQEKSNGVGGLIGNLGSNASGKNYTLTIQNCVIENCEIGGVYDSEMTYTQGSAGALFGKYSNGDAGDTITIENIMIKDVNVTAGEAAKASLFFNAGADNAITLTNVCAFNCTYAGSVATGAYSIAVNIPTETKATVSKVQGTTPAEDKLNVRFLGSIDSLNYLSITYLIEIDDGVKVDYQYVSTKVVYEEVNNGTGKLAKSDFGGNYIVAIALEGVAANATLALKVTPVALDVNENVTVGTAKTITLTNGTLS